MTMIIILTLSIVLFWPIQKWIKKKLYNNLKYESDISFSNIIWLLWISNSFKDPEIKQLLYNFLARKIYQIPTEKVVIEIQRYFITRKKDKLAQKVITDFLSSKGLIKTHIEEGFKMYFQKTSFYLKEKKLKHLSKHPYIGELGIYEFVAQKI